MPDREAIIEAMAEAMWLSQPGPRQPYWNQEVWERFAAAAYDASPIERYRKALEAADSMLTLVWHRYRSALPDDVAPEFEQAMREVVAVSRR